MSTTMIIALLAIGVALVAGSLLLRVYTGGKHEIKSSDLVFIIIPLLLVALATGKLKGVDIFGVKADLSELWATAAQTKIAAQVAPAAPATVQDAIQAVEMAAKGGASELKRLIERKIQALEFKLGRGGYYGPAIKTYFEALSGSSSLRVFNTDLLPVVDDRQHFVGTVERNKLTASLILAVTDKLENR